MCDDDDDDGDGSICDDEPSIQRETGRLGKLGVLRHLISSYRLVLFNFASPICRLG